MTQEEILRMAREAGLCRNKVASWMQAQGYATGHGDTVVDLLKELEWQVRESEREACAKLCAELHPGLSSQRVAEAIRARGQA
jgi:hypothetical protein